MSKKCELKFMDENEMDYSYIEDNQDFEHFEGIKDLLDTNQLEIPKTVKETPTNETKSIDYKKVPKDEETITLQELRLKHGLNWGFMLTSARNILDIGDINEDTKVSSYHAGLIVTESHRLNKEKANQNNPNCKQPGKITILPKRMIMSDLMSKYGVTLETIKNIARKYNITGIWYPDSYTTPQNIKIITEELQLLANQSNSSNMTEENFEALLKEDYMIFIDTCSLMETPLLSLMETTIIPLLEKYNAKIYVVDSVINEIEGKRKIPEDEKVYKKANMANDLLNQLNHKGLCAIADTNSRSKYCADGEFIYLFSDLRFDKHNLCLITNDYSKKKNGGLSGSIMRLGEDPNININIDIKVFSVGLQDGQSTLIEFFLDKDYSRLFSKPIPRIKL